MMQQEKMPGKLTKGNTENRTVACTRITQTHIGDTLYIVEAVQSTVATETVRNKLKRLILNNAESS